MNSSSGQSLEFTQISIAKFSRMSTKVVEQYYHFRSVFLTTWGPYRSRTTQSTGPRPLCL